MIFFKKKEFRDWFDLMNPRLLDIMEEFRAQWGAPCVISSVDGALGRHLGAEKTSSHNVDYWGTVNAVDLFPRGMDTEEDLKRAFECAKLAGASGIGLYTDTKPGYMIHLDCRPDRTPENPATWARVGGEYVAIGDVF